MFLFRVSFFEDKRERDYLEILLATSVELSNEKNVVALETEIFCCVRDSMKMRDSVKRRESSVSSYLNNQIKLTSFELPQAKLIRVRELFETRIEVKRRKLLLASQFVYNSIIWLKMNIFLHHHHRRAKLSSSASNEASFL